MRPHHILIYLFAGYETLDIFGPVGLLLPRNSSLFRVSYVSNDPFLTPIPSNAGSSIRIAPTFTLDDALKPWAEPFDTLMIPGGLGTRAYDSKNDTKLEEEKLKLAQLVDIAPKVFTVCTGSRLLASTGKLDGVNATSNKLALTGPIGTATLYPKVNWQVVARWVDSGKFLSSSGITAGMDAALYLASKVLPEKDGLSALEQARGIARGMEYKWDEDPRDDPFGEALERTLDSGKPA